MKIALSARQVELIGAYVKECEDAEQIGSEWTVDIYDVEPPLSLEFEFTEGGIDVLAACELAYDEGMDGWYLRERIEGDDIRKALLAWPYLSN